MNNQPPTDVEVHEFVSSEADERRCRHCGEYPFSLRHWTI